MDAPYPSSNMHDNANLLMRPLELGPPLIAGIFHAACIIHRKDSFTRLVPPRSPARLGSLLPAFDEISRGTMKRVRATGRNTRVTPEDLGRQGTGPRHAYKTATLRLL